MGLSVGGGGGAGRGHRFKELSGLKFGWLGRFGLALDSYNGYSETAIAY